MRSHDDSSRAKSANTVPAHAAVSVQPSQLTSISNCNHVNAAAKKLDAFSYLRLSNQRMQQWQQHARGARSCWNQTAG